MGEEVWRVILEEGAPTTTRGGDGGGAGVSQKEQVEAAKVTRKTAPVWQNVGKLVGGLVGITSVIAFVFQMIRRSKVFSTVMDSFLTIISAMVDILFMPLVPILVPVLRIIMKAMPTIMEISK